MRHDSLWHVCSGCCYQCTTRSPFSLASDPTRDAHFPEFLSRRYELRHTMEDVYLQYLLQHRCGMFNADVSSRQRCDFSGATWCCNYDVIAMLLPSANASDLMLHRDIRILPVLHVATTSGSVSRRLLDQRLLHQATKSAAAMRYNVPAAYR